MVEVVCEFRFDTDATAAPGFFARVHEELRSQFPKKRPGQAFESEVSAGPQGVRHQVAVVQELRILREDESAFVNIGSGRLAIHHLKPYRGWETFRPLVVEALTAYKNVAAPKGIRRIGLRYVNQVTFPGEQVELDKYFRLYPQVSRELPQNFTSFIIGIEVPFYDGRDILRLQMANLTGLGPRLSVVLDLDYFVGRPDAVTFENWLPWLESAHERIEEVFEGCLTDMARQHFEEVTE